jgi:NitT/TauT family transport system permease protein
VLEVARSLEASRAEVLWRLRLPSSAPFLFAAARVCLPLAVVGAVVAEFLTAGTPHGLGSVIAFANQYDELPVMYAAIVCLAVVGVLLSAAVVLAERELCAWHPSGATAGTA